MFMVVMGHFMQHGIMLRSYTFPLQSGVNSIYPVFIYALCVCAVNTFVLISGYFSIRPKITSFLKLYFIVAFYACATYAVHMYINGIHINRWLLYNTLMPFGLWKTSTEWWFMPNYLILYLLSPILNKAIDSMSKRELQISLVLFSIIIFYFGWYRNMGWAQDGYNFIQFVFLYFVGRYLFLYTIPSKRSYWLIIGWLLGAVLVSMVRNADAYNSPYCVFMAICIFVIFRNIPIKNNAIINWFSASALSIYLLHDVGYFRDFLYGSIAKIYDTNNTMTAYGLIFSIALGIMICVPFIDKIRILITNPLVNYTTIVIEKLNGKLECHH